MATASNTAAAAAAAAPGRVGAASAALYSGGLGGGGGATNMEPASDSSVTLADVAGDCTAGDDEPHDAHSARIRNLQRLGDWWSAE